MRRQFLDRFFSASFFSFLASSALGFAVYIFTSSNESPYLLPLCAWLLSFPMFFYYYLNEEFVSAVNTVEAQLKIVEELQKETENKLEILKSTLKEKYFGFPTLHQSITDLYELLDNKTSNWLMTKQHPAMKSAEVVRDESRKRREAEKKLKITQSIIEFYENLEPSLIDYKEDEFGNEEDLLTEWSEEEKSDPVSYFLTKDEYRNLPTTEKNQLALDKYWRRPHSKWHIGIMYERYIGYLYELKGYQVTYHGIEMGKADLGRDIIAKKPNELIIIQCKNWSQFKTIYEKHIFQFFGTIFQYKDVHKDGRVRGIFYTTTKLSEFAKRFAKELDIELYENYSMDKNYPCIKCNVSMVDKSKIYHLPFDQQYDSVKIEKKKGEFYAKNVQEAEKAGFRRAWKWKGASN